MVQCGPLQATQKGADNLKAESLVKSGSNDDSCEDVVDTSRVGGIGRRDGLRIHWYSRTGSSPALGTIEIIGPRFPERNLGGFYFSPGRKIYGREL